ncbi:Putative peptidoglycan binding domain-containing protein [Mariprofundus ferrinatatus]|uniref:Peptidoglycan binding domain-containing protein n=1 Tax=Mariprofundus ferrinatatus TaxID=1921087 RepID=A0A2K8L452_9PROT|nr:peptidoglycan-binding domain-containing protein [Mariprofundus ferrinatatus]ATX82023.1 Putative peptidoglycan binding domain-containing protein [Mariprofundus ferrinatatus]
MGRDLKMYVRGKGVSMLQELLQRMGYPMNDRPGLFGVSTRDAVKDFQSKKGLKPTGVVDEALLNMLRQNFGIDVQARSSAVKATDKALPDDRDHQIQLHAITRLLIQKGIITEDELRQEIERPQPVRISEPPLT